uniref:Uncharacterized protein n=1 Tax=Kalanchoe fedtschenkoi TaxID=63787 RepID=A0A7N1A793_KALFE
MAALTEHSSTKPLLYEQSHTEDDDDDALSLCDLPIYSTSSGSSSSLSNGHGRGEYQEEADSFFEFGTSSKSSFEDAHDCDYGGDAIIFCGKLIAFKDVADPVPDHSRTCGKSLLEPDRVNNANLKPKKRALFSWKRFKITSFTFRRSKKNKAEASHSHSSQEPSPSSSKKTDKARRLEKLSSAKKVSTLLTSPSKSRWYLFMLGQTRFPQAMTMELSDLKNRQRRRCSPSPSMNPRVSERGADVGRSSGRRGLWSLLKESATTVSGAHANGVVRAVGSISLI